MNNSKFSIDSVSLTLETEKDTKPQLREREAVLTKLIAGLREVHETKGWSSLKTELFDGLAENLSRDMLNESKKENPDTLKLNRLAGQLKWAERYSDLQKLEGEFRAELLQIKQLLYGTTEKTG